VDMRVLIKLAAVSMQGTEDTDLNTLPACPLQHGAGGAAEQVIRSGPALPELSRDGSPDNPTDGN